MLERRWIHWARELRDGGAPGAVLLERGEA